MKENLRKNFEKQAKASKSMQFEVLMSLSSSNNIFKSVAGSTLDVQELGEELQEVEIAGNDEDSEENAEGMDGGETLQRDLPSAPAQEEKDATQQENVDDKDREGDDADADDQGEAGQEETQSEDDAEFPDTEIVVEIPQAQQSVAQRDEKSDDDDNEEDKLAEGDAKV
jgi:hypothetical protein